MIQNMKIFLTVLLLAFSYAECRKAHIPINKNANIDFINMEGGGVRPAQNNNRPLPSQATTLKPVVPPSAPVPSQKPVVPQPAPSPIPAIQPAPKPSPSNILPSSPSSKQAPNLITPKPVNPAPVPNPITTPGPGSVKSLVHFYDSQGKASPIRPYSYSQAVKQVNDRYISRIHLVTEKAREGVNNCCRASNCSSESGNGKHEGAPVF